MKFTKSLAILITVAALLPLASCLKEQADVFETPSSQRMQNYLEDVRKTLQEPKNGWAFSYYPGSSSATCYMGVKFEAQQVTAYSQEDPATAVKSSYKLTTDDGAVLSFDTYNSVLHYYATADADHYQARGGDFEFDIVSYTKDRIVLRGKRSRNLCYLDPLAENKTISAFLTEMVAAKNAFSIVAFSGEITGGLVEGFLDGVSNTLTIGRKGAETSEMVSARYMIVPGGIHFNEPFTFQGVTFQDFTYVEDPDDPKIGTLTGSGITFNKVIPEGFVPYNDFLGKWTLTHDSGSFEVELVALEAGSSFKMKGLSTQFEPTLGYNAARGYLTWSIQAVGSSGANTIKLIMLDSNAGYVGWGEGVGMNGMVEDNTVEKLVIQWKDNGVWEDYVADGVILWAFDSSDSSVGQFSDWALASGRELIFGPISMTKIVE